MTQVVVPHRMQPMSTPPVMPIPSLAAPAGIRFLLPVLIGAATAAVVCRAAGDRGATGTP